ncbi:MAG: dUTP diphosphatase [Porphyromonas somerae]|uniref:dUTP diphosphatase n=1 Tax=Porphyromonas somerae TaxID=322095 RepID=UPI0026F302DD|nr:dUTP diphosphatase [Porphyromonas somerae]MDD7557825.1 dUTP diphosphatase [Porphyromonas somerae]MDY3884833.1 dUTP diphosphatase [Porphyromonas somerae]MDY5814769.1 dUTP diphosphatase [Porphyromonas somerae]
MNNQVEIKIINQSPYPLPEYATPLSAGLDIRANIESPIELEPLQRVAVPTGLYIALPEGYEAQIRPRSGLALKHGLTLLNAPGTIDADYRGEIKAIVANLSDTKYTIEPGERICQMVVAKHAHVTWYVTEALEETERGAGGFGHTGIK